MSAVPAESASGASGAHDANGTNVASGTNGANGTASARKESGASGAERVAQARQRRERARAALASAGFDALVVGRPSNLAYLSGARRVVVRGSRPFAPMAVLLVGSGKLHVQSYSPEADAVFGGGDGSYPQSWDPQNVVVSLGALDELAAARRIGVDGMTPDWEERLRKVAPAAALADAEGLLRPLRTTRTDDELLTLRRSLQVCRAACEAATTALRAGAGGGAEVRHLRAAVAATVGAVPGATAVHEGWCRIVTPAGRLAPLPAGAAVSDGEVLAVDVAVAVDGLETGCGRTLRAGGTSGAGSGADREVPTTGPAASWERIRHAVLRACRPGASGADLAAAAATAGWREDVVPLAYLVGFGPEPPLAPEERLGDHSVLAVQGVAPGEGAQGGQGAEGAQGAPRAYGRDLVLVEADGAELLTPW